MIIESKDLLKQLTSHNDLVVMLGMSENMASGVFRGVIPLPKQYNELLTIKLGLHKDYRINVHHEIAKFCDELLGLHHTKVIESEKLYYKYRDWCNWRVGEPDIKCELTFFRMVMEHMNKPEEKGYPVMKLDGSLMRNIEVMEGCYEFE